MGVKFALAACLAVAGGCLGKYAVSSIKERRRYLDDLVGLASALSADVTFRRTHLSELLRDYTKTSTSELLAKNVEEFLAYASGGGGDLALTSTRLNGDEKRAAREFFTSLGKYDSATQSKVIDGEREKLEVLARKAAEQDGKWSSLAVKLGFLFGACAGVLVM